MHDLFNYPYYAKNFLKIKTKTNGIQPFNLRKYQLRFNEFKKSINGPVRIAVGKPRQCGFTTDVSGQFFNELTTLERHGGIAIADKYDRTMSIKKMYGVFIENYPKELLPMISINNTEKLVFDNPDMAKRSIKPGLGNELLFGTGNDPNAGRSDSRMFAHISEAAFIRYMLEIDDGIQNSIPLAKGTTIIKESTGNGRAGIGKPFFDLAQAAKRGDSIYKWFFIAWYEVDDYIIKPPDDFKLTKYEKDVMKRHPGVTEHNLMWRRLKLSEYQQSDELQLYSPEERFKQDFPLDDNEMFLYTGSPVFDLDAVTKITNRLQNNKINDIKHKLNLSKSYLIMQFFDGLKIYAPPRAKKLYYIGADISEGLAIGDASSLYIMDHEYNQVARWHGKIDPDMFGHLLMELGELYNTALIIPECNNMGHTTVTTIKNSGYPKLYKEVIEDKQTREVRTNYGWRTTKVSKNDMLNEAISKIRDEVGHILDILLIEEIGMITRGENGIVELNGRDRVVAFCLTLMGRRQHGYAIDLINARKDKNIEAAISGTKRMNDIFK